MLNKFFFVWLFSVMFFFQHANGKTLIITHVYNRPDFIEWQCKTFQKFIQDEYEFVVFNDAPPGHMHEELVAICNKWNIRCMAIPQKIHDQRRQEEDMEFDLKGMMFNKICMANWRHSDGIKYSLESIGLKHNGIVVIIDSDMFLTRPINFEKILKDCDIAAVMRRQNDIAFLWPGLTMLAMNRLPNKETLNFSCGVINGKAIDTGCYTYYYLKNNPSLKVKELDFIYAYEVFCPDQHGNWTSRNGPFSADTQTPKEIQIETLKKMGFNSSEITFLLEKPDTIQIACDKHFVHFKAASDYDSKGSDYHRKKSEIFLRFIDEILKQ